MENNVTAEKADHGAPAAAEEKPPVQEALFHVRIIVPGPKFHVSNYNKYARRWSFPLYVGEGYDEREETAGEESKARVEKKKVERPKGTKRKGAAKGKTGEVAAQPSKDKKAQGRASGNTNKRKRSAIEAVAPDGVEQGDIDGPPKAKRVRFAKSQSKAARRPDSHQTQEKSSTPLAPTEEAQKQTLASEAVGNKENLSGELSSCNAGKDEVSSAKGPGDFGEVNLKFFMMVEDSLCAAKTPQALLIPELLRRIFELSTDLANRSNALVCKGWCEEALSVLWSDVEARRLFGLLAPMKLTDSEWSFSRDIEEGNWDRFDVYAWRVRTLRFSCTRFRQSVFSEIALGRRRVDFLPNLAALYKPPSDTSVFPLFAHASVRTLEVHLEFGGRNVGLLASRMRNIERFTCVIPHDPSWSSILSAIRHLTSLKELTISSGCLDLDTFHTLASLSYLRSVKTYKLAAETSATTKGSKVFPPSPFPSLTDLDVHIDFPTAIEWLPIASHARSLRSLRIQSSSNESGADYLQLTNLIGSTCSGLETLELARAGVGSLENAIPADKRCGLETLTNLKALHLRAFDAPSTPELERLLEPLPKLESLSISGGLRKTPLYHLAHIARHCKHLSDLELDIDTTPRPVRAPPAPFAFLQKLHVGSAGMADWELVHVGHFLSRVLPVNCAIAHASGLPPDDVSRWAEVRKWVPVLIQSRMEEKGRSTAWDYEVGRPKGLRKKVSFSRSITEDAWDRFDRYSSKVRSLRFTQRYDPSVFREIQRGRRRSDFLPNLLRLHDAPPIPLFAYPRIRCLILNEEVLTFDETISWFPLIESGMPYMEQLEIEPQVGVLDVAQIPTFTSALRRVRTLRELVAPVGFLNDNNFHYLASMSDLRAINTHASELREEADHLTIRALSKLCDDPFPSLEEFGVRMYFNTAMVFLPVISGSRMLRVLKIASDLVESFDNYMILLNVIALHCPGLEVLDISGRFSHSSTIADSAFIEPNRQLEHALQSLQRLESLALRNFGLRRIFPLQDLPLFAHHLKALKHLNLDVDLSLTADAGIAGRCAFQSLESLCFGHSSGHIAPPTEIAYFLSRILPPNCKIHCDTIEQSALKTFEVLRTWVPILIRARMEERGVAA
ncbi:hypothetical protein EYR36_009967 [Pleurotus pulmonarius]|nr:hypothetical protein EYR36_009967 [Pleurotus pulmonarius]